MKNIIFIFVLFFINSQINAQQLTSYSQYMHNKFAINPAVAGSQNELTIGL